MQDIFLFLRIVNFILGYSLGYTPVLQIHNKQDLGKEITFFVIINPGYISAKAISMIVFLCGYDFTIFTVQR